MAERGGREARSTPPPKGEVEVKTPDGPKKQGIVAERPIKGGTGTSDSSPTISISTVPSPSGSLTAPA